MAMAAHTGCNTVYGSTPPNNPHPYPWMNSLFQDGSTIGWLIGESFIMDHGRRSVIPERLATWLLDREDDIIDERRYYEFTHFSDNLMTDAEIDEMPRVWIVGGDGGMGDIGYQNVSKMILQNRPNVKALMLDTQVYSNTGGQNSDSTPMLGGGDMNAFGAASQGKCIEKKTVAETFLAGHGSPFVAQVSIANAPKLFRAILDALDYRGTAFLQCFTTCQPEHGVGDDMALDQAQRVRDSRGAPEFVFNPRMGETYGEALDLKGNPNMQGDWYKTKFKATGEPYRYTVAHWCATEARFRNHLKKIKDEETEKLIPLENMLVRLTQNDVVYRRHLDPGHRAYVPDFGVYIPDAPGQGQQAGGHEDLAPVGPLLRRAPQGLAPAAEQGRHPEHGVRRPTRPPRRRRRRRHLQGGPLRPRRGVDGRARARARGDEDGVAHHASPDGSAWCPTKPARSLHRSTEQTPGRDVPVGFALRARVEGGRLQLDEPCALPEGTVLDLVLDDEGDDLDASERQALHDAISRAWTAARAGRIRPAQEIIDALRRR